jgi:3-methylcrotonyl-CoA carboxylase alpha subunit
MPVSVKALAHPDFAGGTVDTGLIAREGDALMPPSGHRPRADGSRDGDGAALLLLRAFASMRRTSASAHVPARWRALRVLLHGPGAEEPAPSMLVAEGGQVWRLEPWRVDAGASGACGRRRDPCARCRAA